MRENAGWEMDEDGEGMLLHKGVLQMGVRLLDDLLAEGGNNSRAFPTPP